MSMCWGSFVTTLHLHQGSIHGPYLRRSWRFLICRYILPILIFMRYLLISQRVIEMKPLTEKQYSIQCPSLWFVNCTKSVCIPNKWWDNWSHNSDGTSNTISVHWSNHFQGLYDTNKITHGTLNKVDNHIRVLFFHHIIKHEGNW